MDVLEIKDVVRSFSGQRVLDGVSMKVPERSVYGFLGRNGAGKTTAMKIILGLLRAEKGSVSVMGERVRFGNTPTNRYVGYLPDVPEFYPYMTAREYLGLCAEISGLDRKYARERIEALLAMVELAGFKKRIGGYSRGMKQRLGIAQALLGEPSLLICDEPTSALDPAGRKEILDILREAGRTTTVIFSTHVLTDAERICDRIAILNKGKIALEGALEEIRQERGKGGMRLRFAGRTDAERMAHALSRKMKEEEERSAQNVKRRKNVTEELILEGESIILYGRKTEEDRLGLLRVLTDNGLCPLSMEVVEPSLEKIFMEVTEE